MTGPLDGLVVVDASWGMPGAVTSMMLADYGATVVKVERPGGGPDRDSPARAVWERGKRSVDARPHGPGDGRSPAPSADRRAPTCSSSRSGPGVADRARASATTSSTATTRASCTARSPATARTVRGATGPGFDCLVAARLGVMAEQARPPRGPDLPRPPDHRLRHRVPGDHRHPRRAPGPAPDGRGPARRHLAARRRRRPERDELVVERPRRVLPGPERHRARASAATASSPTCSCAATAST